MIDRSATARALAKAIAFKMCGKHREAAAWAAELVRLLQCAEILTADAASLNVEG
ncbi:MAG: hypothetical protein MUE77_06435 [Sandarakinorhabdus sp.]|jgi:hypothetical protein|nr:hypothetical protein [Sandarakinorhabdus sp.]